MHWKIDRDTRAAIYRQNHYACGSFIPNTYLVGIDSYGLDNEGFTLTCSLMGPRVLIVSLW